ncbi:MAG: hypothetical protein LBR81_04900 [Prevotellaceae bacterium]|jgi:outer membrane lipoprotein-sorting protein|nr:hypothetical protein [Prevotellaceae bacterium]
MNSKKYCIFALLLTLNIGLLSAQNDAKAKTILDKAAAQFKQGSATIDFLLTLEDTKTGKKESLKGSVAMKGRKFKTTLPIATTYYDGQTEYVYVNKTKEVNLSTPTEKEIQEVNPAFLLANYAKNSTIQFSLDSKPDLPYYIIDVYPDYRKKKNYYKTIVQVNKKTSAVISIKVLSQSGVHSILEIKKIDTSKNYPDSFFAFDIAGNPKVIVNDLR